MIQIQSFGDKGVETLIPNSSQHQSTSTFKVLEVDGSLWVTKHFCSVRINFWQHFLRPLTMLLSPHLMTQSGVPVNVFSLMGTGKSHTELGLVTSGDMKALCKIPVVILPELRPFTTNGFPQEGKEIKLPEKGWTSRFPSSFEGRHVGVVRGLASPLPLPPTSRKELWLNGYLQYLHAATNIHAFSGNRVKVLRHCCHRH
ncbi:hypothetical protein TNCV_4925331 [Trichonephila clavipes]|nr:hypothetical protein TNCV_4925331 [Trichonephila clavipes]